MKLIAACFTLLVTTCAVTLPEGTQVGIVTSHGTITVTK